MHDSGTHATGGESICGNDTASITTACKFAATTPGRFSPVAAAGTSHSGSQFKNMDDEDKNKGKHIQSYQQILIQKASLKYS